VEEAVAEALVRTQGLTKEFGGVPVLRGITVSIPRGCIFGIIGENGAGKSTFVKLLHGAYTPTAGRIWFDGRDVTRASAVLARRLGISTIPQEFNLVEHLDVAANIFLGRERRRFGALLDRRAMNARAAALLAGLRTAVGPKDRVRDLRAAEKQMVEIAKAVVDDARLLIMDEPTSVLTPPEVEVLFDLMRRLRAGGTTLLYISHKLREVKRICDEVMVLRDGAQVSVDAVDRLDEAEMARRMVGRELSRMFPAPRAPDADVRFRVEGLTVPGLVHGVSFEVRRGEVVGLAGLVGAGRTEVAEAILGVRRRSGGGVWVDGAEVRPRNAAEAIRHGIAYLPEDRQGAGVLTAFPIAANVTLNAWRHYGRFWIRRRRERERARHYAQLFNIRAAAPAARVEWLSGGNQQKVALAKSLDPAPRVFLFDEPTRGIDVGARGEIYGFIRRLLAEGMACVLISSDLEELLGMCQKVMVMRAGRVAGTLEGDRVREEEIMYLATGVKEQGTAHG
jgi:ribose transport system ATP-binding protein